MQESLFKCQMIYLNFSASIALETIGKRANLGRLKKGKFIRMPF